MFGSCGFLSFSLVFCLLGGRLETTLYIHFIRRWVETRRHSSASRENEDEKKAGRCAVLRSADRGLRLVGWWVRRASTMSLRRLGAGRCLGRLGGG